MCGEVLDQFGDHALSCCCGDVLRSPSSPPSLRNLKSLGSFSLRGPPDPSGTGSELEPGSTPPSQWSVGAAPRTSGFPGACPVSLKAGFCWFRFCSVLPTSPWRTRRPRQPRVGPPSACSLWKREEVGGPRPCGGSLLGSLPSLAPRVVSLQTRLGILAFGVHSASAAPFNGRTRVQSLGGPPRPSMVLQVLLTTRLTGLVGELLICPGFFAGFDFSVRRSLPLQDCLSRACFVCLIAFVPDLP